MRLVAGGGFGGLPPQARNQERALAVTARELSSQRGEWSELPTAFRQAQALTSLNGKPLIVVTAGLGQQAGWPAAQAQLARLSSNSLHRMVAAADHTACPFTGGLMSSQVTASRAAQRASPGSHPCRSQVPLNGHHTALLDNEAMAAKSSQAIRDVVSAVRTGTPLKA